jgi:hypothetical protein
VNDEHTKAAPEFHWCVTGNIPGMKKYPKWMRSAAIEIPGGTVYAPAAMMGNENLAFLCASYDGQTALVDNGHLYLSTKFLAQELKNDAEMVAACKKIERTMLKHFGLTDGEAQS